MGDAISRPEDQRLVCIGGLPGSGKTTLGISLAARLSGRCTLLDPDATRLEVLGRASTDVVRDDDMTPPVTRAVVDLMIAKARTKLRDGESPIVASAFVVEEMRQEFEALARELDATFIGLWLDVPVDKLRDRLVRREAMRTAGIHDLTTVSAVSHRHVESLRVTGTVTWPRIDGAQEHSVILGEVLALLRVAPAADL